MSFKLSNLLSKLDNQIGVDKAFENYSNRETTAGDQKDDPAERSKDFYNLITDFTQYGWSTSIHFAPRNPGESVAASLARHEHFIAMRLALEPGMHVADLGCGIGGPLREIVRLSGAMVTGVNNNSYQVDRARELTQEAGLTDYAEFMECSYLNVDTPDKSFDAAYAIESMCYSPSREEAYREVFRILKPGTLFATYEVCLTDKYDPENPRHVELYSQIEFYGGMTDLDLPRDVDSALKSVGFDLVENRDIAEDDRFEIPWYEPIEGTGFSLESFKSSLIGRTLTHVTVQVLEKLKIAPQGSTQVSTFLLESAKVWAESGRLGILSPMYFVLARKPLSARE